MSQESAYRLAKSSAQVRISPGWKKGIQVLPLVPTCYGHFHKTGVCFCCHFLLYFTAPFALCVTSSWFKIQNKCIWLLTLICVSLPLLQRRLEKLTYGLSYLLYTRIPPACLNKKELNNIKLLSEILRGPEEQDVGAIWSENKINELFLVRYFCWSTLLQNVA